MPQSTQIAAFILGAVLLLIALLGGGFSIFGAGVPGKVGTPGRLVAFVLSLIFIAVGLIGSIENSPSQPGAPISQTSAVPSSASPAASPSQSKDDEQDLRHAKQVETKPAIVDLSG